MRLNRSFNTQRVRPHLYEEELSQVKGSLSCTSCPRRANFSYISSQNSMNCLHEKQKVGLARKVTCLAGSHSFDDRVNLLAMPTFLHIGKHFGLPSQVNLVKAKIIITCASTTVIGKPALDSGKGVNFFLI